MKWGPRELYKRSLLKKERRAKPCLLRPITTAPVSRVNLWVWRNGLGACCKRWGKWDEAETLAGHEIWRHLAGQCRVLPAVRPGRGPGRAAGPRGCGGLRGGGGDRAYLLGHRRGQAWRHR